MQILLCAALKKNDDTTLSSYLAVFPWLQNNLRAFDSVLKDYVILTIWKRAKMSQRPIQMFNYILLLDLAEWTIETGGKAGFIVFD